MSEPSISGHVLIVEDEFLFASHVKTLLEALGFANVHLASSLESAERDFATGAPLFAILDINIGSEFVFPFAEELRGRGVPFLFASGVHQEELPPEWARYPFLAKPLDSAALASIIQAINPPTATVAKERARTLGDMLRVQTNASAPEQEWATLLQSIAAGDRRALHAIHERSHRLVFMLINRIAHDGERAEELTTDVFHDVWRRAAAYDAANGSVLGWIMNQARSRALDDRRFESEGESNQRGDHPLAWHEASESQSRLGRRRIVARPEGEPAQPRWREPRWEEVAPGIECKVFATDAERHIVSMLVRLAPGASYPPHTHADDEELHLLDGELWIDDRKFHPGDYNYGAPGARDERVWSETGCTCVLVTSTLDTLH